MERRRLFVTILLLVLCTSIGAPLVARAATADELRAQIAEILAEINYLRSQLNTAGSATTQTTTATGSTTGGGYTIGSARASQAATFQYSGCPDLQFNLERGYYDRNVAEEVSMLQRFLAQDSSLYPEAEITGYFGPATEQAVQRFQVRHGIVTQGDYQSTGYGRVGPRTRWAIKNSCSGETPTQSTVSPDPLDTFVVTSSSGASSATSYVAIGGQSSTGSSSCFVQPDSGTAPLSVRARLLLGGSLCDGELTYQIDWGDGSTSEPFVCNDTNTHYEQLTHTYIAPAVYPARLIQSHPNAQFADRTCSINVSAVPASNTGAITGSCRSWTDGCNTCSRDYENGPGRCTERYCTQYGAQQCYEYFPSSAGATGDALLVRVISKASGIMEFKAYINVSNSCDGAVYKVYFGDGESSLEPIAPGACQSFERTLRHTYDSPGTYSAFLVKDDVEVDRVTVVISDTSSAGNKNVASVITAIESFIKSLFQ